MSSPEARLKEQIADLLSVSPDAITPATSLDLPRFRSSAGALILLSAVRSATGKTPSTAGVRNFGELLARATGDAATNGTPPAEEAPPPAISAGVDILPSVGLSPGQAGPAMVGCGVDIEDVATMPPCFDFWAHDFYTSNFSPEEIAYCVAQPEPRPHFAARWCAKEALKKSSPSYLALAPADIQVVRHPAGSVSLQVRLAGQWRDAPAAVSLSHTEHSAIAMVILQMPAAPTPVVTPGGPSAQADRPANAPAPRKSLFRRWIGE